MRKYIYKLNKLEFSYDKTIFFLIGFILLSIFLSFSVIGGKRPVVLAVHAKEKVVALTFDDGPNPRYTNRVLDILKNEKIKATFFVVGKSVDKYPFIAKRYALEGHEVGNHTYNHAHLLALKKNQINKEIAQSNQVIYRVTGQKVKWFRPPRRQFNDDVLMLAEKNGLKTVLWNVSSENKYVKTPQDMARRVICKVRSGSIVLMHDGVLDRSNTVAALPIVIKDLKNKGYKFVTLTELLDN